MSDYQDPLLSQGAALESLIKKLHAVNKSRLLANIAASEHDLMLLSYIEAWGPLPKDTTYEAELKKLGGT